MADVTGIPIGSVSGPPEDQDDYDKSGGSKQENEDLGAETGYWTGMAVSAGTGVPGLSYVLGPVGKEIGGMFGSKGTKYGRYYHEISATDEDFAEDQAEQSIRNRPKQNVLDRYVQEDVNTEESNPIVRQQMLKEGGRFNPLTRILLRQYGMKPEQNITYRNLDRAEDINERLYAGRRNQAKMAGKLGMDDRQSFLEDREKKAAGRAMKRSQDQTKSYFDSDFSYFK